MSTSDQADRGVSLEAQRAKVEAYAAMHDLELAEIIEDAGASAKTLDRPGMRELLELVRRRAVDVVVIAKLDRITRSVRDLGDIIERFGRADVDLASVHDHIDTGTAAGRLVLNVMGSVAQWEREAIGERTAEALQAKRRRGERTSRHAPFGYMHTSNGRLEPNESEQAAVRRARTLRDGRLSLRAIAERLEAEGHVSRTGRRLHPSTVRAMVCNPPYPRLLCAHSSALSETREGGPATR